MSKESDSSSIPESKLDSAPVEANKELDELTRNRLNSFGITNQDIDEDRKRLQ